MKVFHHQLVLVVAIGTFAAVTACQSCLIDLVRSGIKGGSESSESRQQQVRLSHAGALPIGLSSGKAFGPTIPSFKAKGIDFTVIGFLAARKLISLNSNHHATQETTYIGLIPHRLRRTLNSDGNSKDKDTETEVNEKETKVEEEGELMSSSMIMAIGFYKKFISPLLPPACRFLPTCSQYGVQAIQEFGPTKGVILTAWRLARCSPFGGKGKFICQICEPGHIPVPNQYMPLFVINRL
jgi:putative membrane protein insertion efficiency factor